jgi:hypothetical protein
MAILAQTIPQTQLLSGSGSQGLLSCFSPIGHGPLCDPESRAQAQNDGDKGDQSQKQQPVKSTNCPDGPS